MGLPDDEKAKIKALLFIMNRFSVSMEAYNEISQVLKDATRAHHVEGCQRDIDGEWLSSLKHTPGCAPGAELPFEDLLVNVIQNHVRILINFSIHITSLHLLQTKLQCHS